MTISNTKIQTFIKDLLNNPNFSWIKELKKTHPTSEIYLVGGSVRDLLLNRKSYDFDFVVRNLSGKELQNFLTTHGKVDLVGKSFGVFIFTPSISNLNTPIEIALPRIDESFNTGGYHDFNIHTKPTLPIEKDLKRRDFTINAMAINIDTCDLIDPFNGQKDLEKHLLKSVGNPKKRLKEDYTRMMRGIRFSAQLNFLIEDKTFKAIKKYANKITTIPPERLQTEINKILLSKNVEKSFNLLKDTNLLQEIFPEIYEAVGIKQGKSHIYTVYEHLIKAAQFASEKEYPLHIIMAALFHDCGKPRTKQMINGVDTYYNHEYIGEKMCRENLNRLKYPKKFIKQVAHLVKNHMFYYNTGEITDAGVRRLIAKTGPENIDDLIRLRMSDRIGMGRPKAKPYKLQELERRIKLLLSDPISVDMLKIDGNEIMELLKLNPSIRLKYLKNALLNKVLENPKLNKKELLEKELIKLNKLSDEELKQLEPNFQELEKERKRKLLKGYKGVK